MRKGPDFFWGGGPNANLPDQTRASHTSAHHVEPLACGRWLGSDLKSVLRVTSHHAHRISAKRVWQYSSFIDRLKFLASTDKLVIINWTLWSANQWISWTLWSANQRIRWTLSSANQWISWTLASAGQWISWTLSSAIQWINWPWWPVNQWMTNWNMFRVNYRWVYCSHEIKHRTTVAVEKMPNVCYTLLHFAYLSINKSRQTEIIKDFSAVPPHWDRAIFAQALIVKAIHLGYLSTLMITAY